MKKKSAPLGLPIFTSGDIGGVVYAFVGNLVNYIIIIVALKAIDWPDELIFNKVIPGLSMGLLISGIVYAYLGWRLHKKTGRTDVTALPTGLSTPAMFVFLYGIIYPLSYAGLDPESTWKGAVAACFLGGVLESLGGVIGPWIRKHVPRVAMLGAVAGIALVWMATAGLFEVYHDPILGMPVLIIALIGLIGGYVFKKRVPMLLVSIIFGIVYALLLGRTTVDFSGMGFVMPTFAVGAIIEGFGIIMPYLPIIIPIVVYGFIETMDNVESARAAGDEYPVGAAQVADGLCTVAATLFGGVFPNNVWLGHPGLKKGGAGIGYSWVNGVLFGLCGLFGLFRMFNSLMPPVLASITFLWCAMLMVVQAYTDTPRRHGAALAIALVPHLADMAYTYVRDALGAFGTYLEPFAESGLTLNSTDAISTKLVEYGVIWKGLVALKLGAILTSILWGSTVVFIIDRRLDKAAISLGVLAVLSFFGFIHAPEIAINAALPYTIAYVITAGVCLLFHFTQKKIMDVPRRFDYV